jgi:hypothetical protein
VIFTRHGINNSEEALLQEFSFRHRETEAIIKISTFDLLLGKQIRRIF